MKKILLIILIVFGFLLIVLSIIASVLFNFHFWYSFFLIGAFLFFGSLNVKINTKNSVFKLMYEGRWRDIIILWITSVIMSFLVDVVYGRYIGNLWMYPYLQGSWNIIIPVFIYYPVGGGHIYEIFNFVKTILSKKVSSKNIITLSDRSKNYISLSLIALSLIGFIAPVLNYYLNGKDYSNKIVFFTWIFTIFSFDAIYYRIKKNSLFIDALQGNKLVIYTMIISWLLAVLSNEIPNLFSHEWIYQNIPFINFTILGVNALIFTFGWFFLVFMPIRFLEVIKILLKIRD